MGADRFYVPGASPVHRLPAQVKIVAVLSFVLVVVMTPREWIIAFVVDAVLLVAVVGVAALPPRLMARRMVIELPFVVFALLLPLIGHGPHVAFGPFDLSEPGLWAAWNILAKGTLGVAASVILAATTSPGEFIAGLTRLRVPGLLVQITAFMIRYLDVVAGESARMRVARASRGFTPANMRAWPDLARSLGTLFIRTYERGERVHTAMLSRGYDGRTIAWGEAASPGSALTWFAGLVLPLSTLVATAMVAVLR